MHVFVYVTSLKADYPNNLCCIVSNLSSLTNKISSHYIQLPNSFIFSFLLLKAQTSSCLKRGKIVSISSPAESLKMLPGTLGQVYYFSFVSKFCADQFFEIGKIEAYQVCKSFLQDCLFYNNQLIL